MRSAREPGDRPVVAHRTNCYFKLSQNWIHTQVKHVEGWQPLVLTHETKNLETVPSVPELFARAHQPLLVRLADGAIRRGIRFYPSFYWKARPRNPRLLHAHFGPVGYHSLPLARVLGVPLVTTFYGSDLSLLPRRKPEWKRRYERLFEQGTAFLVEGTHMRRTLMALGCPAEKVHVHRLGIEMEHFPFRPRRREPEEPLRVLMVGRFVKKKGFPDALRAFAALRGRGQAATLTLIGGAGESERSKQERRSIMETIRRLKLQDDVDLRGFLPQEQLRRAYYEHHLLLSPSKEAPNGDNEGGAPVTLIEASATGLPVVATAHCDIPEVVRHGETGLLASEGDVETLADHLETLALEEGRIETLGRNASVHVRSSYAATRQGERLSERYEAVLAERTAP